MFAEKLKSKLIRKVKSKIITRYAFFDFDYTLAETHEKVHLQSSIDPSYIYSVDNKHFTLNRNKYEDEIFSLSFKDFNTIDLKKCNPIKETIEFMEHLYSQGYKIVILSARDQSCSEYIDTFMSNYTSVKKYKFIGLNCGKAQSKVNVLNDLSTNGSYFVEDSIYNIAYSSIKSDKKIKYVYVHPKCIGYSLDFMSSDKVIPCK